MSDQLELTGPDPLSSGHSLTDTDADDADDYAPADLCSWGVTSLVSDACRITVLWVAGEVDLFTLPVLEAAIADALGRRHDRLIVDLSQLTFCCVRGFVVLERAGDIAAGDETGYAISGCPAPLGRLWSLLERADPPPLYADVNAAVVTTWTGRGRLNGGTW